MPCYEQPLVTGEYAYNTTDARRRRSKAIIMRIWYSKFGEGRATLRYEDGTVLGGVDLEALSRKPPADYAPKGVDINDWESVEAQIAASVTCSTWLVGKGHTELALEHRDEFLKEWYLDKEHWNAKVDELIDYVERKGETPEVSTEQLKAVRI